MSLQLRTPSDKEFQQICDYIQEFELDNRVLEKQEFTAAFRDETLVGFGRLRKHSDCTELCSLGVITHYRRKGIGKSIVKELIKRAEESIHLVCIIPEFFSPFGFKIVSTFPSSIENKIDYCTSELVVPEVYVAMLLKK
jgi:N-acetylglutamate synthase-like GNAT family acetyltransferase